MEDPMRSSGDSVDSQLDKLKKGVVVTLESSDGVDFEVDLDTANMFGTIRALLENCGLDSDESDENEDEEGTPKETKEKKKKNHVPLNTINSEVLARAVRYAEEHKSDPKDVNQAASESQGNTQVSKYDPKGDSQASKSGPKGDSQESKADPKGDDEQKPSNSKETGAKEDDDQEKKDPMDKLSEWDKCFAVMPLQSVMDLASAANYLDIQGLLVLTCTLMGKAMLGKTTEQMRTLFKIKCDFTPEEIKQLEMENGWVE